MSFEYQDKRGPKISSFATSTQSPTTEILIAREGLVRLRLDFATGSFVGSATLQSSDDNGATFQDETDAQGNVATWTGYLNTLWPCESENRQYRWNVTRTSGTLATRLSQ